MERSIRGRVAIVGVGETTYYTHGRRVLQARAQLGIALYSLAAQLDIELGQARDVSHGSREAGNEP